MKSGSSIVKNIILKAEEVIEEKDVGLFSEFVENYFSRLSAADLNAIAVEDLLGKVLTHWQLLKKRLLKNHHVQVVSPTVQEHGWYSKHSIVFIVIEQMPFVIDTVRMELNRLGLEVYQYIHSIHYALRDNKGELKSLHLDVKQAKKAQKKEDSIVKELVLSIEIGRYNKAEFLLEIQDCIENVLTDVRFAVDDWEPMKENMLRVIGDIKHIPDDEERKQLKETKAFLTWLIDSFTFLGFRAYKSQGKGKDKALRLVRGSGLGVLREEIPISKGHYQSHLPPKTQNQHINSVMTVTKTNTMSTVHRQAYTDYIILRIFNAKGELREEVRFIGLFTSDAYESEPSSIPRIREKVKTVLAKANFQEDPHNKKKLMHIIRTLPRDELFQADDQELFSYAMGILALQEKQEVRLFARKDHFDRFISCVVLIPRDNFTTTLLGTIEQKLCDAFNGTDITSHPSFSEAQHAQIYCVIRIGKRRKIKLDKLPVLEEQLNEMCKSWSDSLKEHLNETFGDERSRVLFRRYRRAFSAGYCDKNDARIATYDIDHLENLFKDKTLSIGLYGAMGFSEDQFGLKLYQLGEPVPLTQALPMIEHLNLSIMSESSFLVQPVAKLGKDRTKIWISDYVLSSTDLAAMDQDRARKCLRDCIQAILTNRAETDRFNSLIISAGLNWREVMVLRSYARYLKQIRFPLSEAYIQESLLCYPHIARLLIDFFHKRFDPDLEGDRDDLQQKIIEKINIALQKVENIDQDRIFTSYRDVILATIRTNFYQLNAEGNQKEYISCKFESQDVPNLPLPKPQYEIFVYSPRMEGIHLRADMGSSTKAARGGFRWSDRREDFRTEVLGLMKAQHVKNSLVVPSGAKGGFVLKCLDKDADRKEAEKEAIACYSNFIFGLLDITDNIIAGKVVQSSQVVCHDGEDPYQVAAADKGTATFSDIANGISEKYNFWLGDAFATGGSFGYDHKKMGITSRGAWESVKNHFRSSNVDINKPFTVVGIGDMSGDVFGNGMLMSDKICLVAAFNHRRIFLDPNPDAAKSYIERKRLFNQPGSMWSDYNPNLISKGGGVYLRSVKSIKVTPEVRALLGIEKAQVTPHEMIRAILKAPVTLFWNGGIGTYVKHSAEHHEEVGDRCNDPVRINGNELRCKMIGEGGNLGFTQLARIEFEQHGGLINTDFVDNSAGVDCSDHEVNLKILLRGLMEAGELTLKQRNILLVQLTDEIAELVLQNNKQQNLALSLASSQVKEFPDLYERFTCIAEKRGYINREVEFLPTEKEIQRRKAQGESLTRPEISVLLSYSKIMLQRDMMESDILDDPNIQKYALTAFPKIIRKKYSKEIRDHYLNAAIVATQLSGQLVTEMGITFVQQMSDELGVKLPMIIKSYVAVREILNVDKWMQEVEKYADKIPMEMQITDCYLQIRILLRRLSRWLLRNRRLQLSISETIADFSESLEDLRKVLSTLLRGEQKKLYQQRFNALRAAKVPQNIAEDLALIPFMHSVLNLIEAAAKYNADIKDFSALYFNLSDYLGLNWLRDQLNGMRVKNRWDVTARVMLKAELDRHQRELTVALYTMKLATPTMEDTDLVKHWIEKERPMLHRWEKTLAEAQAMKELDFTVFIVLLRELFECSHITVLEDQAEVEDE
jgi:glutamate dehydrogenase